MVDLITLKVLNFHLVLTQIYLFKERKLRLDELKLIFKR